jgi:hypothetical protein
MLARGSCSTSLAASPAFSHYKCVHSRSFFRTCWAMNPGQGLTRNDVLVSKGDAKGFALNDEIIVLLRAKAQAVVLTVAKGEADSAAVRLYLVACNCGAADSAGSPQADEEIETLGHGRNSGADAPSGPHQW